MAFGITQQELDHISKITEAMDPQADRNKMGSWNILHLVCGMLAGRTTEWQSAIVECLGAPTPNEYFEFVEDGTYSKEELARQLSEEIKEWILDDSAKILARSGISRMGLKSSVPLLTWMTLANAVNARAQLVDELDILLHLKRQSVSWPEAFFSAGLFLGVDNSFPGRDLGQAILNASGKDLGRVKELYRRYGAKI